MPIYLLRQKITEDLLHPDPTNESLLHKNLQRNLKKVDSNLTKRKLYLKNKGTSTSLKEVKRSEVNASEVKRSTEVTTRDLYLQPDQNYLQEAKRFQKESEVN